MTRTIKWTVHEHASEPKWFTHNGHFNSNPNGVRKNGAGRNNWGQPGDELRDDASYDNMNFFGQSGRRNSNHSVNEENMRSLNNSLDNKIQ